MRWHLASLLLRLFKFVLPTDNPDHHIAVAGIEYLRHHRDEFPQYEGNVWRAEGYDCPTHGAR